MDNSMADSASTPEPTPDKTDLIPDSHAIYVETFDRGDNPQLSLKQATLTAPTDDGYWVYTTEYDCFLGCE